MSNRIRHGACLAVAQLALAGCAAQGPSSLLTLRRVVLNQSGSGYFERTGHVNSDRLALRLRPHEVDDVLATLTVLERGEHPRQTVVAAGVPHAAPGGAREESVNLDLRLPDARARDLMVAYAVPTANWQATYRVVLPDHPGSPALVQVWALVHNSSDEDWRAVEMTLATGAPLSFAFHLRTPSFTARPDATGQLVNPVADGPVLSEETRDASEQRQAGEWGRRGQAGGDSDGDRIADREDRCPDQAETYNGSEDTDGCPDSGHVVLENAQIRIMHSVSFDANTAQIGASSRPVLDAVVATMRATPNLRVVEIVGHAAANEEDAWALALDRAASVRAALVAAGVEADRLRIRSEGATHPLAGGTTADARAHNRVATFAVVDAGEHAATVERPPAVTVSNLAASAAPQASTQEFAGATRFTVAEPVSIAAGSAALVTLASREVPGDDVYLFRPESAAPASHDHPYRAARVRNMLGMTLLPGPVALFAGGTFAGEGLLQRLNDGETTFIPYANDPSTGVTVEDATRRDPHRVVSVHRAEVVLEDTEVQTTRYRIDAGAQSPARVYVRHPRRAGYEPRNLPAETEAGRDADVIPVALTPRQQSTLAVEQTRPVTRTLSLLDDITTDLSPYLTGTTDAMRQALTSVLAQRNELARAEREADELREQLGDVASRNAELRETLRTLGAMTDPARVALRAQLTRQLTESMTRHAALSRDLAGRTANASALRTQLIDALRALRLDAPAPTSAPAGG